jgi:isochorismate pyruvate lyase
MPVSSLEDVRREIDRIDRESVRLLAERGGYVREAARFKRTVDVVKAQQRVEAVIAKVHALSMEHNLDPAITERIYRTMIAAFAEHEIEVHRQG